MNENLEIISVTCVDLVSRCGIVATFSDGTMACFPPEELAALRPHRDMAAAAEEAGLTAP